MADINKSLKQGTSPNVKSRGRCVVKSQPLNSLRDPAVRRPADALPAGMDVLGVVQAKPRIFTTLSLWPAHATWDGFINGWKTGTEYNFGHYMLNTFKYVIPKVLLTIISSTIVAYGFARFEIPWKKFWFATLITTMLLPSTVLLIPQYLMFREMGMLNSYLPLYLPLAFATQGFFVFMLIQFLRGVPRDMEEAAQIDGCNSIQVLWYVVVPILKPAIISVALFQFMWS